MGLFVERFSDQVKGVVSGFDRVGFRGTIRWLASVHGMETYLSLQGVLLKDFARWAEGLTLRIRSECSKVAESLGIRSEYLRSSSVDKEAMARQIAAQQGVSSGPICMFSSVEPSLSPTVVGSRESKKLQLVMRPRKCVWIYFYWNDPRVGFGHVRLQTWAPFTVKGCLNGRHWLERGLLEEGIDYLKHDNCFRWIADVERAQQLLDGQLCTDWPALFNSMVDRYLPVMRTLFCGGPLDYYWSADETQLATDVMFADTAALDRLFPMLVRHALNVTDSAGVMRYLGRLQPGKCVPPRLRADVRSDLRRRHEGVCVKHRLGANSLKTYNKAGNVLRVETTINNTRDFKVLRIDEGRPPSWLPMRKGVADMHRRATISQASNERYLDAMATCASGQTLCEALGDICRRTTRNQRPVRAINPFSQDDLHLLKFLAQGQWNINGLRNRDLAKWTNPEADTLSAHDRRRLTARAGRLLNILRAHGLIRKVPKTHRYMVTQKGAQAATTTAAASTVQTQELVRIAA